MHARAALLLALVVTSSALVVAQPTAGAAKVVHWDYQVDATDPASGAIRVTIQLSGVKDLVDHIDFLTATGTYNVTNVSGVGTSNVTPVAQGYRLTVKEDVEAITFVVAVDKVATRANEFNAYMDASWGLFRSEAFAIGYSYSYVVGTPFTWNASIGFTLPSGWAVEAPWAHTSATTFTLAPGETLPRGYVVVGPFKTVSASGGGKTFRYVKLGSDLSYANDVFPFLEKVTPYYANVYGDAADANVLVVSAPKPMFTGGLGAPDSLYVNDESDIRTLAHEYAHVWQLFGSDTNAGRATIWINEGDAEVRSALGLFVTSYWSIDQVNGFFNGYTLDENNPQYTDGKLPDAVYGTPLENLAYHKGALVLLALDQLLADKSGGSVGLSDLLRALNAKHDPRATGGDTAAQAARNAPVSNDEALAAANDLVHLDLTPFWSAYVTGTSWPAFKPVAPKDDIELTNLTLVPDHGLPGTHVGVSVRVQNRGISASSLNVPLDIDGREIAAKAVNLDVGEERTIDFAFDAPGPGDHTVKALYLDATFHSQTPAKLTLSRLAWVPERVVATRDATLLVYVENSGEADGNATVAVTLDNATVFAPAPLAVPGNSTQAASFAAHFDAAGPHAIHVTLRVAGSAPEVEDATLAVDPAPASGSATPAAPLLLALVAVASAALAMGRARRR
ncbi:MAG: M1 aminopeptidase family protein [Thermoplasmatota archaeon]